jgi:hypothetical protein
LSASTGARVGITADNSSTQAKVGGVIFDYSADVSSTSTDGTEDNLFSSTTPANLLAVNNDKVRARYGGIVVGHATATRKIKVYFAGTAILDTTALISASNSNWCIDVLLIRVSSTVVRYVVYFVNTGFASVVPVSVGELTGLTLSGTNILKITGAAAAIIAMARQLYSSLSRIPCFIKALLVLIPGSKIETKN